ncbi:hypothetical protein NWE73_16640 [Bdellovibrio sp. PAP01]|uniref:Uncharacterized protein n=2 Tax=Bdellovibrio svalbardensis TaxID=2972972 RepID=A0ABT6DS77_9BACT|nr:hypothetical protein [Bdellovibrio svalbardensis]
MMVVVGCSFQKDPNKTVPEPVKVGMTKQELEDEIVKTTAVSFADKVRYAIQKDDEAMFSTLMSEVDKDSINSYSQDGATILEYFIKSPEMDLFTVMLLSKGASPYKRHRGTLTTPLTLFESLSEQKLSIKNAIAEFDKKEFLEGSLQGSPGGLWRFYLETGFPLTRAFEGNKTILKEFMENVHQFPSDINGVPQCDTEMVNLINLVSKIEGADKINWRDIAKLAISTESPRLLLKAIERLPDLPTSEKFELLKLTNTTRLEWIFYALEILEIEDKPTPEVRELFLQNINKRGQKELVEDLYLKSVQDYLNREGFMDIYTKIFEKVGKNLKPQHIPDSNALPGGKYVPYSDVWEMLLRNEKMPSLCSF